MLLAAVGALCVGALGLGVRVLVRALPTRVHGVREDVFREALRRALASGTDGQGIFVHVPGGSMGLQWEAQHLAGHPGIVLVHPARSPHRDRIVALAEERGFRAGPPARKRKRDVMEIRFGGDADAAWELTLVVLECVYGVAPADADYFVLGSTFAEAPYGADVRRGGRSA